ncbi:hypothetical protein EXS71_00165 [Candidatus Uhrbacteria bacterium]|nr:hypothetical protein [Candidatus Uhrbacteria bacterium]
MMPPPGMMGDGPDMAKVVPPGSDLAGMMMTGGDMVMNANACASCVMGQTMLKDCMDMISYCMDKATDTNQCPKTCSCGFDLPGGECPMGKPFNWTMQVVGQTWSCDGQPAFEPKQLSQDGEPLRVDFHMGGDTNHATCVGDSCWYRASYSPLLKVARVRFTSATSAVIESWPKGWDVSTKPGGIVGNCTQF